MSDTTNTPDANTTNEGGDGKQDQGKTFTQAELDQIITDRLAQQAKNKFPNYEDYKAKAEGAKTIEQKLVELETKHAEAEARALRSNIATKHGISAEDRDLFLTGSDEASLEAQAKRLAERNADQKKGGNRAPREGRSVTTTISPKDAAKREWLQSLSGD